MGQVEMAVKAFLLPLREKDRMRGDFSPPLPCWTGQRSIPFLPKLPVKRDLHLCS